MSKFIETDFGYITAYTGPYPGFNYSVWRNYDGGCGWSFNKWGEAIEFLNAPSALIDSWVILKNLEYENK